MRIHPVRVVVGTLWIGAILGLIALGTWQVQRRAWKLDLIARVEAGLKAAPVAAPAGAGPSDAYKRVVARGRFLAGKDSFVQASTVRGPGFWTITPFVSGTRTILVNRGWVPTRTAPAPPGGVARVTGLLRVTEPGGGFLRSNDARADRWYSRDVAAIAARHGLTRVAPYFIDADASGNVPGGPVGGLTIVAFSNNHLVYAITWYVLALMAAAAFVYWVRVR